MYCLLPTWRMEDHSLFVHVSNNSLSSNIQNWIFPLNCDTKTLEYRKECGHDDCYRSYKNKKKTFKAELIFVFSLQVSLMFLSPLRWPVLPEAFFLFVWSWSRTLPLYALLSSFLILLLGNPHLLKGSLEMKITKWETCCTPAIRLQQWKQPLTSDARMEPPIQALNLRSRVVLLAINFKRMLCGKKKVYIYI